MSSAGGRTAVIGYIRVSMAREEMLSPQIQRAAISDWAARSGRVVTEWIEDLDQTGRNFRRKVMTGIARVEDGRAAEIAVYRYDRWGRNAAGALANIRRVEVAGGSVVSVTEPFDAETAIGRYTRTNALAMAEMLSDIIGENWRAALSSRVARGLPATGGPRFGYVRKGRTPDPARHGIHRRDPGAGEERYEPDPETGPVLAELYARFISGQGTTRLLKYLNGSGVPTVRGGTWTIQTLSHVLDSGFAAGLLKVHDPRCGCRQPSRCHRVTWVPGAHEPVITMAQWEAYRTRRARMRDVPPRSRVPAYPLTGLVHCGTCQGPLIATHAMGQAGWGYRCNNWVQHRGCPGVWARRSVVEAEVLAELRKHADDISARAAAAKARARIVADASAARRRLTADLARADRELVRLVRRMAAADDSVPDSVWEAARAELLAERAAAERALASAAAASEANEGDWLPVARELLDRWDHLPPSRRRDLLAAIVDRVVVTRTGVRKPPVIDVIPVWEAQGKD